MKVSTNNENANRTSTSNNKAETKKKSGKKGEDATESADTKVDTKVELSAKAKALETPPPKSEAKEIKEAESLVEHVNNGTMSQEEKDLALKRVGDILKKYGHI